MRELILLAFIVAVLTGCGQKADQGAKPSARATQDELLLQRASERLIADFSKELKTELLSALNRGGPVEAVEVCHTLAPQIAAGYSSEGVSIARVTDRPRNAANVARPTQSAILKQLADTGEGYRPSIAEWSDDDSGKVYQFYKPIRIMELCTRCHGDRAAFGPELAEILKEKYPDDKAVGYRPGELRGMFVVSIRWPEGRPAAEQLANRNP